MSDRSTTDEGIWNFQTGDLDPGDATADTRGACLWVDDPDGLNSHGPIVGGALLQVCVGVCRGENFDDEQRRIDEDFRRVEGVDNHDIRNADPGRGDSNSLLGGSHDLPDFFARCEPTGDQSLDTCVLPLAHVSLLQLAVDVFAVWAVGSLEVLLQRGLGGDSDGCGHDLRSVD